LPAADRILHSQRVPHTLAVKPTRALPDATGRPANDEEDEEVE